MNSPYSPDNFSASLGRGARLKLLRSVKEPWRNASQGKCAQVGHLSLWVVSRAHRECTVKRKRREETQSKSPAWWEGDGRSAENADHLQWRQRPGTSLSYWPRYFLQDWEGSWNLLVLTLPWSHHLLIGDHHSICFNLLSVAVQAPWKVVKITNCGTIFSVFKARINTPVSLESKSKTYRLKRVLLVAVSPRPSDSRVGRGGTQSQHPPCYCHLGRQGERVCSPPTMVKKQQILLFLKIFSKKWKKKEKNHSSRKTKQSKKHGLLKNLKDNKKRSKEKSSKRKKREKLRVDAGQLEKKW